MLQNKNASLVLCALGTLLSVTAPVLQTPALAARKAVSVTIKKKSLRPTVLSAAGQRVTLAFTITAKGGTITKVQAQAKLDRGSTSGLSTLSAGRKHLFSGSVNVPRNLLGKKNPATIYLLVSTSRGTVVKRQVGRVTLLPGDNSLPPPPPPK